jgi:hypothetical protein
VTYADDAPRLTKGKLSEFKKINTVGLKKSPDNNPYSAAGI